MWSFKKDRALFGIREQQRKRKSPWKGKSQTSVFWNRLRQLLDIDIQKSEFHRVTELRRRRPLFPTRVAPGTKQLFGARLRSLDRLAKRLAPGFPLTFEWLPGGLKVGVELRLFLG